MSKQSRFEDLAYWKNNAEENYMTTPISVLKYIHKLEEHIETIKAQLPSDEGIDEAIFPHMELNIKVGFIEGAKWMRDKIQGGDK